MTFVEPLIILLDTTDSTNNYAMQLIDADKARHGLTIVAQSQSGGKGQRGRTWKDEPGQSLLMSIVVAPQQAIREQFTFNASVAVAIAKVLRKLYDNWHVHIKWPNDIIVNDKKAGGILIENVLRGSKWAHSIIGLGLNVKQASFPADLPFATSLKIGSGKDIDITHLRDVIRESILAAIDDSTAGAANLEKYNQYLYKRGQKHSFSDGDKQWLATIIGVHNDGTLEVQLEDGSHVFYHHGQVTWNWQ